MPSKRQLTADRPAQPLGLARRWGFCVSTVGWQRSTTGSIRPWEEVLAGRRDLVVAVEQLLKSSISRGEFARQVPLRPSFIAAGFELESPTRSQVTVSSALDLRIQRSGERFLLVKCKAKEGGAEGDCEMSGEKELSVTCTLPEDGTYFVQLFIGVARYGTFDFAGQIEVNKS
ncbi:MAG: hypothetical protein COW42_07610 [Deltaproteobacteria bacterium CG17_big_fil_post_rev_8_21_14_2_50_63_7]|nr:MAG: hypothetical protein COW42_07610 [Deltaproteobacteria bacterium CG17_big_fil_post_rev_8_21_14_2_50_63_7]